METLETLDGYEAVNLIQQRSKSCGDAKRATATQRCAARAGIRMRLIFVFHFLSLRPLLVLAVLLQ